MADVLPIPKETLKRSPRVRDAARLYIHSRITSFKELSERCRVGANYLGQVAKNDGWDELVQDLAALSVKSVWSEGKIELARAKSEVEAIHQEVDRQREHVPELIEERDRVKTLLKTLEPDSKEYATCLRSYQGITASIEHALGVERWQAELSAARTALARKLLSSDGEAGEHGHIVEL
jgi:hypothetical protein